MNLAKEMLAISSDQIHLWFAKDIPQGGDNLRAAYQSMLSSEEIQRHQRFKFAKDRDQFLLTRALVRTVLSHYVPSVASENWRFVNNEYGKPAISNDIALPIRFNVSHTQGLVVMALALGREVGVDVEWTQRKSATVDIAERYFSAKEIKQLMSLPAAHQCQRFFDLWTLKESYIKVCGKGLSMPLDKFSFLFSSTGALSFDLSPELAGKFDDWDFWQIDIDPLEISVGESSERAHKLALALDVSERVHDDYTIKSMNAVPLLKHERVDLPILNRT